MFLKSKSWKLDLAKAALIILAVVSLWPSPTLAQMIIKQDDQLKKYQEGRSFYKNKKYKQAILVLKPYIENNLTAFEARDALFYLGYSYYKEGNFHDAIKYLDRIRSRYTHARYRTGAIYWKGVCLKKLGLRSQAITEFQSYLKEDKAGKHRYQAMFHIAAINDAIGLPARALPYYEKLYRASKKWPKKDEKTAKFHADVTLALATIYTKHVRKPILAYQYLIQLKDNPLVKDQNEIRHMLREVSIYHLGLAEGLAEETIATVAFDGDSIWIGNWLGGVTRFFRSSGQFKTYTTKDGLVGNAVRDILVDVDDIWIATYDGISRYSRKLGKFFTLPGVPSNVQSIHKDGRYLYFATLTKGVWRYDRIKKVSQRYRADILKKVRQIRGNDHHLAFITLGKGIYAFEKKSEQMTHLSQKTGLAGDTVNDVLIDGNLMYVGYHGQGLDIVDLPSKKVKTHVAPAMDTIHPMVSRIIKRDTKILVATLGGGLRILDLPSEKWDRLTVIEGLQSNEIKSIALENDYIWLVTLDQGITIIYRPLKELN